MKLLIVEGNNKETRILREASGIIPYHLLFEEMLNYLVPNAKTVSIFPADSTKELPSESQLKEYDGILWTGSSLSVLDDIPSVTRQLDFAETIFDSGIPMYGSCWGMQVATVVAGGKVDKSKNQLEIGISKPILLTDAGKNSPLFKDRSDNYHALCIHYDEVAKTPKNAIVMAYNEHSKVQAMTFNYNKGSFFGVQYHPEFNASIMALIISHLSKNLVDNGSFNSMDEARKYALGLTEQKKIPEEIINYKLHTQEIMAWLTML
ncbi:MAG: type 1 glutamine amidotransferase [Maribacter sp.]|nr:type 1 glutamine amidotransferase [Maribacter sp.]